MQFLYVYILVSEREKYLYFLSGDFTFFGGKEGTVLFIHEHVYFYYFYSIFSYI